MFYAVDFKDGKVGIWDNSDDTVEYYDIATLKQAIKYLGVDVYGVELDKDVNPIYTIGCLTINLLYRRSTRIGKFRIALLREGERWGCTFENVVKAPIVAFFDTSTSLSLHRYPSGQYVTSYYAESILELNNGLILDTDVDSWRLSKRDVDELKKWITYQLNHNK